MLLAKYRSYCESLQPKICKRIPNTEVILTMYSHAAADIVQGPTNPANILCQQIVESDWTQEHLNSQRDKLIHYIDTGREHVKVTQHAEVTIALEMLSAHVVFSPSSAKIVRMRGVVSQFDSDT